MCLLSDCPGAQMRPHRHHHCWLASSEDVAHTCLREVATGATSHNKLCSPHQLIGPPACSLCDLRSRSAVYPSGLGHQSGLCGHCPGCPGGPSCEHWEEQVWDSHPAHPCSWTRPALVLMGANKQRHWLTRADYAATAWTHLLRLGCTCCHGELLANAINLIMQVWGTCCLAELRRLFITAFSSVSYQWVCCDFWLGQLIRSKSSISVSKYIRCWNKFHVIGEHAEYIVMKPPSVSDMLMLGSASARAMLLYASGDPVT